MDVEKSKWLQHSERRRLIALSLLFLLLAGPCLRIVTPAASFIWIMEGIPALGSTWVYGGERSPPCELRQAARFVLGQPEFIRYLLIAVYDGYLHGRSDLVTTYNSWVADSRHIPDNYTRDAFKLFILLRLLFDVPQDHPAEDSRRIGVWVELPPSQGLCADNSCDLLWPLEYQDDHLVLRDVRLAAVASRYRGLAEYDYFASRFSFRSSDDLW
jgi:hypothetical protein